MANSNQRKNAGVSFFARHFVGPGLILSAFLGSLVVFWTNPDILTKPSILLSDVPLIKKAVFFLALALGGLKAHHTFGFGADLMKFRQNPDFRKRELLWWGPIYSILCLSYWDFPYNLLVFFLSVPLMTFWELREINSLKKKSGDSMEQ